MKNPPSTWPVVVGMVIVVTSVASVSATEFAIIAPSRIVIGRNVQIEGAVGTRFGTGPGELDDVNADPLTMRGDFCGLDEALNATLDLLYGQIATYDVDGDNRLRTDDPIEVGGLIGFPELIDYDLDGAVDDFDLFLAFYDVDGDGGVTYEGAFSPALATEFRGIDDQLAQLIDEACPDRDGDGEFTLADIALGYRDGVLDGRDAYARVRGQLVLAVTREEWETQHGESYQTVVQGPVRSGVGRAPVVFGADETVLPEITRDLFAGPTWFEAQVPPPAMREPGDPPVDPALLVNEAIAEGPHAGFVAAEDADWESMPYRSAGAYDYYQRPVYRDYTFRNVRIPMGNNALFVNCTFVGVTFIESEPRCTHHDWNYAGAVEPIDDGMGGFTYELRFPELPPPPPDHIDIDGIEVRNTREYSNNIRFHECTFLGSLVGSKLDEHTHWRNAVQITGATRWFLYADEVDPPALTDAAGVPLTHYLERLTIEERRELARSSVHLPGWAVHIGNFGRGKEGEPRAAPPAFLRGLIVTDTLLAQGTLDVFGTVISGFRPVEGEGALFYGGRADQFLTVLGYVEPEYGDKRPDLGAIRLRHDPAVTLP